jgi:transcriptional regulator with XRE-family HTH domain
VPAELQPADQIRWGIKRRGHELGLKAEVLLATLHEQGHTDLSYHTVYSWLRGHRTPGHNYLPAIADALGVKIDWLYRG